MLFDIIQRWLLSSPADEPCDYLRHFAAAIIERCLALMLTLFDAVSFIISPLRY